MARIRTIKPEFFTSSQVVSCGRDARLVFVALLVFSDDSGIHPADPRRLKLEAFPGDDCSSRQINQWVDELICTGLIERYEANKSAWWRVTGWQRHQRIDQPTFLFPLPNGTVPETPLRRWQKAHPDLMGKHKTTDENGNTTNIRRIYGGYTELESSRVETNSVRPFEPSDHLEVWADARRLANETARKLWPDSRKLPKPEDQRLLLRVAFLARSLFSDGWLADAIGGATGPKVKNRAAYLKRILSETARRSGHDLNALLDSIAIPAKEAKRTATKPPTDLAAEIGKMPAEAKP